MSEQESGKVLWARLGEVMQDAGSRRDGDTDGWFILGVDGYFDVDNSLWCPFDPENDAPWNSEWFDLHGTLPEILANAEGEVLAVRYALAQARPFAEVTDDHLVNALAPPAVPADGAGGERS